MLKYAPLLVATKCLKAQILEICIMYFMNVLYIHMLCMYIMVFTCSLIHPVEGLGYMSAI